MQMKEEQFTPQNILMAYSNGYFPMAHEDENNDIYWHRPKKRAVFLLDEFEPKKDIQKLLTKSKFNFSINTCFDQVIDGCSKRESTWISKDIKNQYLQLNKMGYAYSFEAWHKKELVGGLYGIVLGKAFFGESMFHTMTDASKATFGYLISELKIKDFMLLDSQYLNSFTKQLGAIEISDDRYMKILQDALQI
jgi:leucyl/phenylalanyl-tRNA--protein transferase